MNAVELLGYAAGTISTLTFLPQVIKTWKTKKAGDVSLLMFVFATISVIMWLVYGILINNGSIIYTNGIIFVLSLLMLYFKWKWG